jgi:hypothetical protein
MVQNAVPDSDVVTDLWEDSTGGDSDGALWDEIDDVPADFDTTYIRPDNVAFPDGDVSTGSWTSTPLWSKIDELVRDTSDLVTTTVNNSTDSFRVSLTDLPATPVTDDKHLVRVSWDVNQKISDGLTTLTVTLIQGASTQIAQKSQVYAFGLGGPPAFLTLIMELTPAEAANITDYTDLAIDVSVTTTATADRDIEVFWANLQIGKTRFECGLSNVTDPDSGAGHVVRIYYRNAFPTLATLGRLNVQLLQGVSVISEFSFNVLTQLTPWLLNTHFVPSAEADAITDYSDLRLSAEFEEISDLSGFRPDFTIVEITQLYLEVPDAVIPPPNVDVSHAELVTPDHADHEEREAVRTDLAEPIGDLAEELGERVIEPNPLLQEAPIDD